MANKQIQLSYDDLEQTWNVSITDNGRQWNTVFKSENKNDANIISSAFEKVGYEIRNSVK